MLSTLLGEAPLAAFPNPTRGVWDRRGGGVQARGQHGAWGPTGAAPGNANLNTLAMALGEKHCFSMTCCQAAHLR